MRDARHRRPPGRAHAPPAVGEPADAKTPADAGVFANGLRAHQAPKRYFAQPSRTPILWKSPATPIGITYMNTIRKMP